MTPAIPVLPDAEDRLLPWKKVKDITGLSRTTAWRRQKAGDFPQPVVISPGRVGWRESEIAAWKASRGHRAPPPPPKPALPPRSSAPAEPREPSRPPPDRPQQLALPTAKRAQPRRRSRRSPGPDQLSFNF